MKIAVPVSCGRISATLDFAQHLLLVECEDGHEVGREESALEEEMPARRARRIESLGVTVLICGAISRSLSEHLESAGITIIPFVGGPVEQVLAAYLTGQLDGARFLMPGSTSEDRAGWRARR